MAWQDIITKTVEKGFNPVFTIVNPTKKNWGGYTKNPIGNREVLRSDPMVDSGRSKRGKYGELEPIKTPYWETQKWQDNQNYLARERFRRENYSDSNRPLEGGVVNLPNWDTQLDELKKAEAEKYGLRYATEEDTDPNKTARSGPDMPSYSPIPQNFSGFQSWGPPTPSSSSAGIKTTFFGPYGEKSSNENLLSSARTFSFSRPPQLDSSFYQGNQTSTFPAGGMGSPSAAYPAGGMGSLSAAYPAGGMGSPSAAYPAGGGGGGKNQNTKDYLELPAGWKPPPPKAGGSPFYSGPPQPSGSPRFFGNLTWTRKA